MKILVLNWQDIKNPLAGGAEVHLHEVFSRIARRGHSVTLYCSAYAGAPHEEMLDGLRVIREGGRSLFNYRVPFAYWSRFRKEQFDIVIDDVNKIPFFTPLYVKEPLHGVIHHLFSTSIFREVNPVAALYVYLMERLAVWLYKGRVPFIVGSPSTYHEMLAAGFPASSLTLINYAVNHDLFCITGEQRSATPLIGYFGRLKKYKSVDHLLQALPLVTPRFPDLKVLIVGEGDDRPRLEEITRQLGLQNVVRFTGFVSEEEKVRLLQQMWVKVTTSSKEGWGLTVIEANACGTPVVASNVQGLRDAVRDGETGLLYRYGDVRDLAEKITMLLEDDALRKRLTGEALKWAQKFSWENAAEQTLVVLENHLQARVEEE